MELDERPPIPGLKVLVVFNDWIYVGGGGMHTIELAKALSTAHDVHFLLPQRGFDLANQFLKNVPNCDIAVYTTPFENRWNKSLYLLYLFRAIKSIFLALKSKDSFDVIISNSQMPFNLLPAIFFKIKSRCAHLIVYFHGGYPRIKTETFLRSIISNAFFRFSIVLSAKLADFIFVINDFIGSYIVDRGVSREKIAVTSNFINFEIIDRVATEHKKYDAVYLGRVDKYKGAHDLVDVWKRIVKNNPAATLCVVGDGSERRWIETKIAEGNLSGNVIITGQVFGQEKYHYLKSSRVFVYPSYVESWGIVIAEAIACGLPVVAYNLPVYRKVFSDNILTVELANTKQMAEQIIHVLENYDAYKELIDQSKRFIIRYNLPNVIEKERALIEEIVNR